MQIDIAEVVEQVWDRRNISARITMVNDMGLNMKFGKIDKRFFSELTQTKQLMLIRSATSMNDV